MGTAWMRRLVVALALAGALAAFSGVSAGAGDWGSCCMNSTAASSAG